jgi:bifunctional enzyme CysN/CysC
MGATPQIQDHLQVVMTGHVDHGKSSLLGRLYADAGVIPPSLVARVKGICERQGKAFEHAFLFDAFLEEQEQGITIDTARTFFAWKGRRYAVLDAPGHREFLKNMVTGASRAEAALLVIDAAEGVREQSRRHGYLLKLLGVRQVAVVVNKMDLQGYGREAFEAVREEYRTFLGGLGIAPEAFVPASAREGENVVHPALRMPWYEGPTVVGCLEAFRKPPVAQDGPLRLPLQDVYKFDGRRILAGRVESGALRAGDALRFWPSGRRGQVDRLERFPEEPRPEEARAGWCTGFTLEEQLFLERGEVACHEDAPPQVSDRFEANLFWMGREALRVGQRCLLRLGTQEAPVAVEAILRSLDAGKLEGAEAPACLNRHEAGELRLRAQRPLALDLHAELPSTGRFILEVDGDIQGGGIVTQVLESSAERMRREALAREERWREGEVRPEERFARNGHGPALLLFSGPAGSGKARLARLLERRLFEEGRQVLLLDSKNLRAGLSVDLAGTEVDEPVRRFGEVAALLLRSGFIVACVTNDLPAEAPRALRELAHPYPVLHAHLAEAGELLPEGALGLIQGAPLPLSAETLLRELEGLLDG